MKTQYQFFQKTNNSVNVKHVLFSIVYCLLVYFVVVFLLHDSVVNFDIVVLTFIINIGIFTLTILMDKRTISLNKIYGYFMLVFMGFAPLHNYVSNYSPWSFSLTPEYYFKSNLFLLVWSLIYCFIYLFLQHSKKNVFLNHDVKSKSVDDSVKTIFFVLSILLFLFDVVNVGWSHLFIRGENTLTSNSPFAIVLEFIIKFTPVVTLYLYLSDSLKKRFTYIIKVVVLFGITFILNYPVSNSRFNTAAVGFTIILAFLLKSKRRSYVIDLAILLGVVIVFPVMSAFKNSSLADVLQNGVRLEFASYFNSIDFDAYSFVGRGLLYVEQNGLTDGRQIISTIFFFVPRSILPIKGINTGELIVVSQTVGSYSNVSCPFMMELYIDFGYAGLLLGPAICACAFFKFDYHKDLLAKKGIFSHPYMIGYSLFFGFMIYVLRGSLAPTFLRLMGAELVVIILAVVNTIVDNLQKMRAKNR